MASIGSLRLARQSEILRSGRHFAPSQFWSQALSPTYQQLRSCHTTPACANWSICTRRTLFVSETAVPRGQAGILTVVIFDQIDSIFHGKSHQAEKSTVVLLRSKLVEHSDSDVGIFLHLSICTMSVGFTPVAISTYAHFKRLLPTRVQRSFYHFGPQDFVVDIDLGEALWASCGTCCQHIDKSR